MKKITFFMLLLVYTLGAHAQFTAVNPDEDNAVETLAYVYQLGDKEYTWTDQNSFEALALDADTKEMLSTYLNFGTIENNVVSRGGCTLIVDCSNIVDTDLSCRADLPPVDFDLPIIIDACPTIDDVIQSALTIIPGNSGCPGDTLTITRTYFLQDVVGNMDECMQTFTIESMNAPTVTCNSPTITEQLDANCMFALGDYTGTASSTSDCSTASISQMPAPGTMVSGATTTVVTITATDFCNRTTTCTIDVVTEDNIAPTAVCVAPIAVQLDANGEVSITAAAIDGGSTDSCGAVTLSIDVMDFDCTNIGDNTVTLTVMDASGNMDTCMTTVTVEDMLPPVITCDADIVQDNDAGQCEAVVTVPQPMVTDNCSVLYPADAGRNATGVFDNLYTRGTESVSGGAEIVNANGMSRTNFTGVNKGIISSTANAPSNTRMPGTPNINLTQSLDQETIIGFNSVSCNAGGLHADNSYIRLYDLPALGFTDDFMVSSVDFGVENASGVGGTQPMVINIYSYDTAQPFEFGNFTLITSEGFDLADTALTVVNQEIFATVPAGSAMVVELFSPEGQTTGNSFFIGSNALGQTGTTFLAAAACGITEPTDIATIGFPAMQIILDVNSASAITLVNDYNNTADATDTYPVGETMVTWTATDGNGNVSTCVQLVTVEDNEAPVVEGIIDIFTGTGPNDGTCTTIVNYDFPTATDNCSNTTGVTIEQTGGLGSGSEFPVGVTTEEFTVTEENGTETVFSFNVTITDTTIPSIDCPDNFAVAPNDAGEYEIDDFSTLVSENCSTGADLVITQDPAAGTVVADQSTTTISITATDAAGNVAECSFELTVDETLSVDENGLNNSIGLYPNPARDMVTLSNGSNSNLVSATIFDMNGRLIKTIDLSAMGTERQINISMLAQGVYFLQIADEKNAIVKRLIKQ